jgi:hypothetical protein
LKQPTRSSCAASSHSQQLFELGVGLAGEADDEGAAQRELGHRAAPGADAIERVLGVRGRRMRFSTDGLPCWKGTSR